MIKYRRFESQDAEHVFETAMRSWKETYKNIFESDFIEQFVNRAYDPGSLRNSISFIQEGWTEFYIAEENDEIIGFAQIGYTSHILEKQDPNNHIFLYRIYIEPKYLGQKVGSNLLSFMEKWVKSESRKEYGCYCQKENEVGKQFYLRKNFNHIPERDNKEENELFLSKQLN